MVLRPLFLLLLLLLAGCGGGSGTSSPPPAAVRLAAAHVGTDGAGNDVVTVTATVTDAAGRPVSCPVEVRVNRAQVVPPQVISRIACTSDENGQVSLPVAVDPLSATTITAVAGPATSNTISASPSGNATASAVIAVVSAPDGRYSINCSQFDNIAGIGVTVLYDPAAGSEPVVEAGTLASDARMVWNADTPGTLRIASVVPYPLTIPGEGTLAAFHFTQGIATSPGTISSIQVQLYDVGGKPVPARTMLISS